MSEYTQRYQHVSHKELYDAVRAGDPGQIDGLASQWSSLKDTLSGLARDLDGDLDRLAGSWTGDAAREFQERLSLVSRFSTELADGMSDVGQALTMMAGQLRVAQQQAESPEETDDHDKLLGNAAKGAVFGVGGMVVGGLIGHQQDKAEQEKAHQRMVLLVAELSAGYDVSAYGRVVEAPPPDGRLPGGTRPSDSTPRSGPVSSTPTAAPTTGVAGPRGGATVATPTGPAHGPTAGSGSTHPGDTSGTGPGGVGTGPGSAGLDDLAGGTSLAGADPLLGGAVLGGGALGAVGLAGAVGTSSSTLGALGGLPVGGVVGGAGSLASSGRAATLPGRTGVGPTGAENRSATGTGRLTSGQSGGANGGGRSGGAANRAATAGGASRNGVLGGRGQQGDDESDERLTWLTEDEMVWQDASSVAPPVLGGDR
ncbi:WXG100 family type VII secretion target [Micromonospora sp. CPCC 205711]|uniref:WXG100 family type VII secretion target n=1 Tax=Micromonospora sp. CPCC 205547 TaxID=3122400 RepID=UPI002FF429B1